MGGGIWEEGIWEEGVVIGRGGCVVFGRGCVCEGSVWEDVLERGRCSVWEEGVVFEGCLGGGCRV